MVNCFLLFVRQSPKRTVDCARGMCGWIRTVNCNVSLRNGHDITTEDARCTSSSPLLEGPTSHRLVHYSETTGPPCTNRGRCPHHIRISDQLMLLLRGIGSIGRRYSCSNAADHLSGEESLQLMLGWWLFLIMKTSLASNIPHTNMILIYLATQLCTLRARDINL